MPFLISSNKFLLVAAIILTSALIFLLKTGKFQVDTLLDSARASELIENKDFDILLLDMDMPNVTGLDVLKYIKDNQINLTTVVLTGVADIDLAISAMKLGTFDYLLKPLDEKKLLDILDSAVYEIELRKPRSDTSKQFSLDTLKHKEAFSKIITRDEEMLRTFHLVEKYAITNDSIIIWGESGTGKELIAEAIHKISSRRDNKFIPINAGAFANELFSSEFFGHAKGAFTGADTDKKGFIDEANGVFLARFHKLLNQGYPKAFFHPMVSANNQKSLISLQILQGQYLQLPLILPWLG